MPFFFSFNSFFSFAASRMVYIFRVSFSNFCLWSSSLLMINRGSLSSAWIRRARSHAKVKSKRNSGKACCLSSLLSCSPKQILASQAPFKIELLWAYRLNSAQLCLVWPTECPPLSFWLDYQHLNLGKFHGKFRILLGENETWKYLLHILSKSQNSWGREQHLYPTDLARAQILPFYLRCYHSLLLPHSPGDWQVPSFIFMLSAWPSCFKELIECCANPPNWQWWLF